MFTALYPRLCAYIDGVTGRGDLGDDIIQEIFYKFLRRRPCLDRAKVPSYLFSMAHNECLNWLRRNKILYNSVDLNKLQELRAWETLALCDFLDAPNDSPLATLLIEEVLALCDRLPPRTADFPDEPHRRSDQPGDRQRLHIAQRTVEKHISFRSAGSAARRSSRTAGRIRNETTDKTKKTDMKKLFILFCAAAFATAFPAAAQTFSTGTYNVRQLNAGDDAKATAGNDACR